MKERVGGGRTMGHTNTQTYRRTDAGPLGYIDSAPHTTRAMPVIRFAFSANSSIDRLKLGYRRQTARCAVSDS